MKRKNPIPRCSTDTMTAFALALSAVLRDPKTPELIYNEMHAALCEITNSGSFDQTEADVILESPEYIQAVLNGANGRPVCTGRAR